MSQKQDLITKLHHLQHILHQEEIGRKRLEQPGDELYQQVCFRL